MNEVEVGIVKGIVKGAVSLVPVAGPIMTAVYDEVVSISLQKRRAEWEKTIEDRLEALEDSKIVEKLVGNESFVSCLLQATREAMSTHQNEKIDRLANAVVNSIDSSLEDDRKEIFLHWIERYSELHIKLLIFLNDPAEKLIHAGWDISAPSPKLPLEKIIGIVYPNKKIDANIVSVIINELHADGLVTSKGLSTTIILNRGFTTDIAKEFIEFISNKQ